MRTTAEQSVDVLIVGAGLSGIGAACHLRRECPERTFTLVEARDCIGGTWDLFRYPGIRSDSDMQTLGYAFAPWQDDVAIAEGPAILDYVRRTAAEYEIEPHIRFGHRVLSADYDSARAGWTVQVQRTDTGETTAMRCSFLLNCSGYYDYAGGYAPEFADADRFAGTIVHPQHWPEDLDCAGKRVAVIGSGATAITLVPALADTGAQVTMVQRSPTYVVTLPAVDVIAAWLRRRFSERLAYTIVRAKNVALMTLSYQLSQRFPRFMRAVIRHGIRAQLPDDFDVDTHFAPRYRPWDQRLCVCPDGDLFEALRDGSASIVTGTIERFTEDGLVMTDGTAVVADVIVTATGLRLQALGGTTLSVDGDEVRLPERLVYRGMMLSGVPNFALTMGYTNASWTLKADLVAGYMCRVLNHMRRHGYREYRPADNAPGVGREPLLDLSSGYVQRSIAELPRQGSRRPWRMRQNYALDRFDFRRAELEDGVLRFSAAPVATAQAAAPVAA